VSLTRTRDHWSATAALWTHGDAVLTWHFTLEDQPEMQDLARMLSPTLERPYLDVVPPQWLHVTTQGVGLCRAVDPSTQARLVAEVEERLRSEAAPNVTVGPPRLFDEGVGLPVDDGGRLQAIRLILQEADAGVRGIERVPDWRSDFDPHISLAYANSDADAADLVLPDTRVPLTLRTVSLIRLERTRGLYSWQVASRVPIGR
jgi:2'-5' RNA ligase superfamily